MPECTPAKHDGGDGYLQSVAEFGDTENIAAQRQQLSTYIEGFLQQDRSLLADLEDAFDPPSIVRGRLQRAGSEGIHGSMARAGESREFHAAGHGDMVARYTELMGRAHGSSARRVG